MLRSQNEKLGTLPVFSLQPDVGVLPGVNSRQNKRKLGSAPTFIIAGRKPTGWKSIAQDIRYAGGDYLDQEVVVDGNLVSSRSPADLPAFIEASLKKLS